MQFCRSDKNSNLWLNPFIPLLTTQSTEKFGLKTKCTLITSFLNEFDRTITRSNGQSQLYLSKKFANPIFLITFSDILHNQIKLIRSILLKQIKNNDFHSSLFLCLFFSFRHILRHRTSIRIIEMSSTFFVNEKFYDATRSTFHYSHVQKK